MNLRLIFIIVAMILALVFYTWSVINVKRTNSINKTHILLLWLGFIWNCIGIYLVSQIVQSNTATMDIATATLQSLTGMFAVFIMLFHCIWATWILIRNNEFQKKAFYKYSLIVWVVWLAPYGINIMLGMGR